MELRQLRYFIAVAEELHFGRAARRLYMAQPPLSQQIRKLEDDLGAPLFVRTSRSVSLTRAGRALLARARDILREVEEAEQEVRLISRGHKGALSIGFIHTGMETCFADVIREFRRQYRDVDFDLQEMHSTDQVEALREGSLDVGLIRLVGQDMAGLAWEPLSSEPYVVALPEDHLLCARDTLALHDLHDAPLVFFYRYLHPRLHDDILGRFAAAGATPDIVMRGRTTASILALVSAGMGLALVSRQVLSRPLAGVSYRPLVDALPPVVNALAWNPERDDPLVGSFVHGARPFARLDPALPRDPEALLHHTRSLYAGPAAAGR